ncbi:Uncharacterized protein PECH_002797 [Penicillium ucsense]|uniref:Uncharacterized protein n=1 Tax=Penicillium ucsense TaxID=2839758 RepID=A0A8J8VYC2_9EURO|nr:Uncharacterized protein PECM_002432 [Penicillium ucsense]KAF7730467.1 Uncharacterized protein PECH_002797 [Penicillium ucsense]
MASPPGGDGDAEMERLNQIQMADLGTARRELISTSDETDFSAADPMVIERHRRSNIPGTREFEQAQRNREALDEWNSLHETVDDTGHLENLDNLMHGQSHRARLTASIHGPHALPAYQSRGNHPYPIRSRGRGGGVSGTRGRGNGLSNGRDSSSSASPSRASRSPRSNSSWGRNGRQFHSNGRRSRGGRGWGHSRNTSLDSQSSSGFQAPILSPNTEIWSHDNLASPESFAASVHRAFSTPSPRPAVPFMNGSGRATGIRNAAMLANANAPQPATPVNTPTTASYHTESTESSTYQARGARFSTQPPRFYANLGARSRLRDPDLSPSPRSSRYVSNSNEIAHIRRDELARVEETGVNQHVTGLRARIERGTQTEQSNEPAQMTLIPSSDDEVVPLTARPVTTLTYSSSMSELAGIVFPSDSEIGHDKSVELNPIELVAFVGKELMEYLGFASSKPKSDLGHEEPSLPLLSQAMENALVSTSDRDLGVFVKKTMMGWLNDHSSLSVPRYELKHDAPSSDSNAGQDGPGWDPDLDLEFHSTTSTAGFTTAPGSPLQLETDLPLAAPLPKLDILGAAQTSAADEETQSPERVYEVGESSKRAQSPSRSEFSGTTSLSWSAGWQRNVDASGPSPAKDAGASSVVPTTGLQALSVAVHEDTHDGESVGEGRKWKGKGRAEDVASNNAPPSADDSWGMRATDAEVRAKQVRDNQHCTLSKTPCENRFPASHVYRAGPRENDAFAKRMREAKGTVLDEPVPANRARAPRFELRVEPPNPSPWVSCSVAHVSPVGTQGSRSDKPSAIAGGLESSRWAHNTQAHPVSTFTRAGNQRVAQSGKKRDIGSAKPVGIEAASEDWDEADSWGAPQKKKPVPTKSGGLGESSWAASPTKERPAVKSDGSTDSCWAQSSSSASSQQAAVNTSPASPDARLLRGVHRTFVPRQSEFSPATEFKSVVKISGPLPYVPPSE